MQIAQDIQDDELINEFKFVKNKHIGALTLNIITTTVKIRTQSITIQKENRYLETYKRILPVQHIPLSNITNLKMRKVINLGDMALGVILFIFGFSSKFFWLLAILAFWMGFSNKIIITTHLQSQFKIPVDSTKDAQAFIAEINKIPMLKAGNIYVH